MKIAIVTRSMHAGGAERVIAQLADFFVSDGMDCEIITINEGDVFYELDRRVRVFSIGKKSDNKLIDRIKRYSVVRKRIVETHTDVVLSFPEEIGVYTLLAMRGTGIPVYVSERNDPHVMPDVRITRILRTLMYPFAKGVIFQTETARAYFPKRIQAKSVILDNPVDKKRIPEVYRGKRKPVIVSAGRLEKQKNFAMLIEAFNVFCNTHSEYSLIIYGEGSQRKELESLIETLGLEKKVFLPGRTTELPNRIRDAAMFVLPSDYEGMPNVLIEAMCMGMPVISTDCPVGGPGHLIKSGVSGILVPVGDKEKMQEAMCTMTDAEKASEMGSNAYISSRKYLGNDIFFEWKEYITGKN